MDENLSFTVCIQRSIISNKGNEYEPQEFNIFMNVSGIYNVYNSLAAISCALYYDIDINIIKKALSNIKNISRRFEKIYDNNFIVIDDFCHNPASYQAVLDRVRSLKYNKIIIVNAIRGNRGVKINKENAYILASWYEVLNKPKIIITLSDDIVDINDMVNEDEVNQYKNTFSEYGVEYKLYDNLYCSIEKAINYANKDDIILLLGSQGMNKGNEIFKQIVEIS
jgi:UDP-N-acetylmuramoyl-L-alanyl-D-glutamate--2,6-diaminopimelate ligase